MAEGQTKDLDEWLKSLVEGSSEALSALLEGVELKVQIENTKATLHCYALTFDGNHVPRAPELADKLSKRIVDYAIPRHEREAAHARVKAENSWEAAAALWQKAARLFVPTDTTGEPGEVLIYLFAETYLRLPQLLCKMPLKTNANVHVHGIDGLHVGYDEASQSLCLYWGESKLKADFSDAVKECLEDLKPFVCMDPRRPAARERDLHLARQGIGSVPKHIEDALLAYLAPQSAQYQKTAHRGIAVIGFDHDSYPSKPNSKRYDAVVVEFKKALLRWRTAVQHRLGQLAPMDCIELEVFLLPLPDVQRLRDDFLTAVRNVPR